MKRYSIGEIMMAIDEDWLNCGTTCFRSMLEEALGIEEED